MKITPLFEEVARADWLRFQQELVELGFQASLAPNQLTVKAVCKGFTYEEIVVDLGSSFF